MGERRSTWRSEDGQAFPILLVAIIAVLATGAVLMKGGRLTELRAEAVTAADASALAAADAIADELEDSLLTYASFVVSPERSVPGDLVQVAREGAAEYAARNGAILDAPVQVWKLDSRRAAVRVQLRTERRLGGPAPAEVADARATAEATAVVEVSGFLEAPPGGSSCLTSAEVAAVQEAEGVEVTGTSGLGPSCRGNTRGLVPGLQRAVVRVEAELGRTLPITSGFRSIEEQLRLWEDRANNPYDVAPPGRSHHNFGLAIDVSKAFAVGVLAPFVEGREATYELCWYGPRDDVHFWYCPDGVVPSIASLVDGIGHALGLGVTVDDPHLVDPARL